MTNKYLQVGCLDGYKHALYNRREQPISTLTVGGADIARSAMPAIKGVRHRLQDGTPGL